MTNYIHLRELIGKKIKKCKRICRRAFKKEFKSLIICWCVTAVVTFAGVGIYFLVVLLGLIIEKSLVLLGIALCVAISLPLYAGNVLVTRKAIKGEKVKLDLLFYGYFNFKSFWKWIFLNLIILSPGWILAMVSGFVSSNSERFLFFLSGKSFFYVSVLFEILTIVVLFLNLSKSIYFFFSYDVNKNKNPGIKNIKKQVENSAKSYFKNKKCFLRHMLSHFWMYLLIFFATKLPLWISVLVLVFSIGYFSLSVLAFQHQFRFEDVIFYPLPAPKGIKLRIKSKKSK